MNDLISRSALKEKFEAHKKLFVDAWGFFSDMPLSVKARVDEIDAHIADVVNAPAVEAAPVVRCKDCYYFRMYHCKHPQWECPQGFPMVAENDFCSYGERRNGDETP